MLALRLLAHDEGIGLRQGADALGAVLVTAALMLGVYTIVEAANYGWTSLHTLGLGAVSLALLGGFVARQATASNPLLPLRLFRSRNVAGANLIMVLLVAGMFGMFFLGSLYLERVLGYDAVEIGLAFLPVSLGIGALSLGLSPQLNMRFGPAERADRGPGPDHRRPRAVLARAGGRELRGRLLPSMVLFGIGAGLAFPADGHARDDRRHAERLGAALRARQHDAAGRRRPRPGDPRHARDVAHGDRRRRRGVAGVALTDGYQLAFTIGAAFVVSATRGHRAAVRARRPGGRAGAGSSRVLEPQVKPELFPR